MGPSKAEDSKEGVVLTMRDDRAAGVSLVDIEKSEYLPKSPFDGLTSASPNTMDTNNTNLRIA